MMEELSPSPPPYEDADTATVLEQYEVFTEADFYARVQNPVTRVKDSAVVEQLAYASYNAFTDNFFIRASALCILTHRVLEPSVITLDVLTNLKAEWIFRESSALLTEGLDRTGKDRPRWDEVRWTCSLANVTGFLLLCYLSKVSALNFLLAFFMVGLLHRALGNMAAAKVALEQGVLQFKDVSGVQDLLRNFWVLGDIQNMALVSRQCFVALARWGLLNRPEPLDHILPAGARVDIKALPCPLRKIVAQNLAPGIEDV